MMENFSSGYRCVDPLNGFLSWSILWISTGGDEQTAFNWLALFCL
jgi:hypothetical protein